MSKTLSVVATTVGVITAALCVPAAQAPAQPPATPNVYQVPPADEGPEIPEGFTPIFNGKDLTGWHVSKTNHHGTTPDYRVLHGLIVGTQNPRGKGGIFLTDKKYKNFEVYLEWNHSLIYCITVSYLGTRMAGAPPVHRGADKDIPVLSVEQVKDLQRLLVKRGYDVGDVDGKLGAASRAAVKAVQMKLGLPADSYPTPELLEQLGGGGLR